MELMGEMKEQTVSFDELAELLESQKDGVKVLETKIDNLGQNQLRLEKSAYEALYSVDTTLNLVGNSLSLFKTINHVYEALGKYIDCDSIEECKQNITNILELVKEQQCKIKELENVLHHIVQANVEVGDSVRGIDYEIAQQGEKITIVHEISKSLKSLLEDTLDSK